MQIKELMNKIEEYETIIIHRHLSPDIDAIGSQMALKEMLKINYPNKKVFAAGIKGYEQFNFIGEIDKLSPKEYQGSLVIVVDTANYARIDDENFKLAKELIKIDHHQDVENERYGTLNLVDPIASSTCEVLYVIYQEIKKINPNFKLNVDVAKYLFAGIFADTGGFIFPNTKSRTFAILSELVKYDFDYEPWNMNLRVLDEKIVRLIGYAMQNIEINDGVGIIRFDQERQRNLGATPRELSIVVNYMGMFKNIKVWAVFNEHPNFIRVNMRSRSEYDISKIAVQYRGGGHKNASGAMVYTWQEANEVQKMLEEMVK